MVNQERQHDTNFDREENGLAIADSSNEEIGVVAEVTEPENIGQQLDLNTHDITVSVRCEIGSVNLSLHDLHSLKIGDTVDFMRWPGFVRLSANNIIFAEGVLVDVNGMLGVKITKSLQKTISEV